MKCYFTRIVTFLIYLKTVVNVAFSQLVIRLWI